MQRKNVAITIILLGLFSFLLWLLNLYIWPLLGEQFESVIIPVISLIPLVAGFISILNDSVDFFNRFKKESQTTKEKTEEVNFNGDVDAKNLIIGNSNTIYLPSVDSQNQNEELTFCVDISIVRDILKTVDREDSTEDLTIIVLDAYLAKKYNWRRRRRKQVMEELSEKRLIELRSESKVLITEIGKRLINMKK